MGGSTSNQAKHFFIKAFEKTMKIRDTNFESGSGGPQMPKQVTKYSFSMFKLVQIYLNWSKIIQLSLSKLVKLVQTWL
jgi:hypothetical protein